MSEVFYLLFSLVFVQNIVLGQYLGLCPFVGVSKNTNIAMSMGAATTFVLTLSSVCAYLINTYLLIPFEIIYLKTIFYITTVALIVSLTELIIQKTSLLLHQVLGIYLPLITTNCAVLGVMLISTREPSSLIIAITYGLGSAMGFTFVMIVFSCIRERLSAANIPPSFRGAPIAFVTAGLMAMAFTVFSGI